MRRRKIVILLFITLFSSMMALSAWAGSVNGNEQSIIGVARGQFEKDGVIYAVAPEYIGSLSSYLAQDDVDLTAEQAQSAIAEIYANVQTGVESGYLVSIGGAQAENDGKNLEAESGTNKNPEKEPEQNVDKNTEKTPEQNSEQNTGKNSEANSEANSEDEPKENSEESSEPNPSESQDLLNNGTTGDTEDKELTAPPAPPKISKAISILELAGHAPPQTYSYVSADTDSLMSRIHIPYSLIYLFLGVSAVLVIGILGFCIWKKLFDHRRLRTLRKGLRYVLAVNTTLLIFLGTVLAALWIGAFQDSAVLNRLGDTGYYQQLYDELKRDTSISFALLDIPDQIMDRSITYEKVVTAARQQVENDLHEGSFRADSSLLIEPLKADIVAAVENLSVAAEGSPAAAKSHSATIEGQSAAAAPPTSVMTEKASVGLESLMLRLGEKYQSLLKWPFASWWATLRTEFKSFAFVGSFCLVGLAAAAQLLIVFLNHYRHRGVVLCGKCVIAGGCGASLVSLAGLIALYGRSMDIIPEYMGKFFSMYAMRICETGILTGLAVILAGGIYLGAVKAWKEVK